MKESFQCRACGVDLSPIQRVRGICEDAECRRRDAVQQIKDRRESRMRQVREILAVEYQSLPVVSLPSNTRSLSPLPLERREAFVDHLKQVVRESLEAEGTPDDGTAGEQANDTESDVEAKRIAAGCGLCRGYCCHTGGTRAWLEPATIRRCRANQPELTDGEITDLYLSYLPSASYTDACVYQGDMGCTLPREMRADMCNTFLCDGVVELLHQIDEHGPTVAVAAVSSTSKSLERLAAVDEQGRVAELPMD